VRLGFNGRFLHARPSGVQRFARELLTRLARLADVTLFLPGGVGAPRTEAARSDTGRLHAHFWEQLELPLQARRARVDVLLHPANAAPLWGGPNVVVLHDLAPLVEPAAFRPAYRAWARVAHVAAARRAAAVVTVSVCSASDLARLLRVPPDRITVVRQGAGPLDSPASAHAVEAARGTYGLARRYFLAATGGDPRKGEAFLRALWASWPGRDAPELVIVGGRYADVHAPVAAAFPETDPRIRTLGHVPDETLRALYTGAVALLHPSRLEGFGRPPLEALACGTRVLVTPYAAAAEILGDTCDRVPEDADAWRCALVRLLSEDAGTRARHIEAGRRWAATFEWDAAATELLRVCRCVGERVS
jgi:glycosyltransferase involved in cell wall biosynthesis